MPLYVVKRRSSGKLVDHSGFSLLGTCSGCFRRRSCSKIGGRLASSATQRRPAASSTRSCTSWVRGTIEHMMADETGAMARLRWVLEHKPRYDAGFSNCEHLVSFVETGEANSRQVRGITTIAVAAALLWGLGGSGGAEAGSER